MRAVYEIMWQKFLERVRPQRAISLMGISHWIPKATNTPPVFATFPP